MRRLKVKEPDYKKYNYFVDLFVVWCCDQSFTHDQVRFLKKLVGFRKFCRVGAELLQLLNDY